MSYFLNPTYALSSLYIGVEPDSVSLYAWGLMNMCQFLASYPVIFVVQVLSCVPLSVTPWTAACQAPCLSLSPRVCLSLSIESVVPSNISSSATLFSSFPQSFPASGSFLVSQLFIRWPKYWSFSFHISPSNEYSGVISFGIDWFDLQGLSRGFSSTTIWKHQFFGT